jgi:hypothetical protein
MTAPRLAMIVAFKDSFEGNSFDFLAMAQTATVNGKFVMV